MVCLHVGSSSTAPTTSSDAPSDTIGVLFFGWAMFAAVDWLYSRIPVRFPDLQDLPVRGRARLGRRPARPARPRRPLPADVRHVGGHRRSRRARCMQRNFWFCAIDDPRRARAAPPHRRRPHPARVRLPAPGRHVARHPGPSCATRSATSRPTTSASSRGRTRRSCSGTRCPPRCRPTPTRTD